MLVMATTSQIVNIVDENKVMDLERALELVKNAVREDIISQNDIEWFIRQMPKAPQRPLCLSDVNFNDQNSQEIMVFCSIYRPGETQILYYEYETKYIWKPSQWLFDRNGRSSNTIGYFRLVLANMNLFLFERGPADLVATGIHYDPVGIPVNLGFTLLHEPCLIVCDSQEDCKKYYYSLRNELRDIGVLHLCEELADD
jgi:hypothetical protein